MPTLYKIERKNGLWQVLTICGLVVQYRALSLRRCREWVHDNTQAAEVDVEGAQCA